MVENYVADNRDEGWKVDWERLSQDEETGAYSVVALSEDDGKEYALCDDGCGGIYVGCAV